MTTSAAPQSDTTQGHVFRFFDLPRELRDEVYELLPRAMRIIEHPSENFDRSNRVWFGDRPERRFMLVTRQFKEEYAERPGKIKVLLIQDNREFNITVPQLSALAKTATVAKFELACNVSDRNEDFNNHLELIKSTLEQFSTSPNVVIRICFEKTTRKSMKWKRVLKGYGDRLNQLRATSGLQRIELYSYQEEESGAPKPIDVETRLIATYSSKEGWVNSVGLKLRA